MDNDLQVPKPSRREFLRSAVPAGGVVLLSGTEAIALQEKKKEEGEENVSTNEDLMREHGILKRVLLAYDEIIVAFTPSGIFRHRPLRRARRLSASSLRIITRNLRKTTCSRASARQASWSIS